MTDISGGHREVFEGLCQAVIGVMKDGGIVLANRAASDILCSGKEVMIGKNIKDIFPPEWTARFFESSSDAGALTSSRVFDLTISAGGNNIHTRNNIFAGTCFAKGEGPALVIISVLPQGTASSDSGLSGGKSEFRVDHFFNQQTQFVLAATKTNLDIIDDEFNLRFVDEEWRRIYGDPSGRKCYDYFADRDKPCPNCGLLKAFKTKKPVITEEVLPREENRSIQVTSIPFKDESGKWLVAEVNVDISQRKKMEEDISRMNIFLDTIIENVPNMIFLKEAKDLKFVKFNRAGEELLGYSREELLGKNDYDFFPKDQADFFVENDRKVVSGEGIVDIPEELINTRHKGTRTLHTKKLPIRDENGNPAFLMGVSEDITERKQIEDNLRESEEKFRTLVKNVPGLVYRCLNDEYWTMSFVSDGVLDLTGYTKEDVVGNRTISFEQIIHPDDRLKVRETINEGLAKKEGYQIDYRIVTSSGSEKWVRESGRGIFDREGGLMYLDGVLVDITEHVRAEQEVQKQWTLLSNLMDNIPFFVFWKNRDSVYLGCNKVFAVVSGVGTPENIVGKTDYDLAWKKEESDFFRKIDREVMESGECMLDIEETQLQSGGREAIILTSKVPLRDSEGNVNGVLGIYADITERKASEVKLKLFKDLMNQSSDSLFILDVCTGKFFDVNDQAVSSLEYSREELLNMGVLSIEELIPGEKELQEQLEEVKKAGSIVFRGEHRKKSGDTFPVEISMKYVEISNIPYIVAVARDITERIQLERQLRDSEKKYRTIFANTGTIMAIVDKDRSLIMANSEFVRFFGFDPEDMSPARKLDDLIQQSDLDKVLNYHRLRRIDPVSVPSNYEVKMIDRENRIRVTYVTVAVIPGTENTVLSFLDLTALKEKEAELEKQRDLLDSTNKVLEHKISELNSAISHIKRLEGLVPICSSCKKIMKTGSDPKKTDSWVNIEKYISDRTEASFTHGLCPDCIGKLYGDYLGKKGKGK